MKTFAHLGHDARILQAAVVIDRGLVTSHDPSGDQHPQPVVAFADLVLRQRMSTGLHPVGDAAHRELSTDEHDALY